MPAIRFVHSAFIIQATEAQKQALKIVRESSPSGSLGRLIKRATLYAHYTAVLFTHVFTSALRKSHIPEIEETNSRIRGKISISRYTTSPIRRAKPYKYGIIEHDRGGSHAFYQRTYDKLVNENKLAEIAGDLVRGFN